MENKLPILAMKVVSIRLVKIKRITRWDCWYLHVNKLVNTNEMEKLERHPQSALNNSCWNLSFSFLTASQRIWKSVRQNQRKELYLCKWKPKKIPEFLFQMLTFGKGDRDTKGK